MEKFVSEIGLSEFSPNDKPWDVHRAETQIIGGIYGANDKFARYSQRMGDCSKYLVFGEVKPDPENPASLDKKIKLVEAHFCRVRLCPTCAWRKTLALIARFLQAWREDGYAEDCRNFAYIHVVFTVKNPPMAELKSTVKLLNDAFKKLLKRKEFLPVCKGFIKSIEITKGNDDNPHPHLHVTLAVNKSYFTDRTYIKQSVWVDLWQDCLGVDYNPLVSVKRVKLSKKRLEKLRAEFADKNMPIDDGVVLSAALVETVKYSVKPADVIDDPDFLYGLTEQVRGMRFLEAGGCFKGIFKDTRKKSAQEENDELMLKTGQDGLQITEKRFGFEWYREQSRYILDSVFYD